MSETYRTIECGNNETLVFKERSVDLVVVKPISENSILNITVESGAGVHVIISSLPKSFFITVEVAAQAQFTLSILGNTSATTECTIVTRLIGEQANVHIQTALVVSQAECNMVCTMEHACLRTLGRITTRRIVNNSAHSMFKGMLRILPGAHGTDTYLSDKALTIGELSQAKSDPGLEILADDVKASHGATIGRLNEEELFYLRSRGMPKAQAQGLLIESFLNPALIGVPLEVVENFQSQNS